MSATRAALAMLFSLGALGSCARPPAGARPSAGARAPSFEALLAAVRRAGAHRFDAAAVARGCPSEQSLGEYLALLERTPRESEVGRFRGGCESVASWAPTAIDPPTDPAYWACRIEAYASDPAGESPWRYELRLRVSRRTGELDLARVACPGGS